MTVHVFTLIISLWGLLAAISVLTSPDYDDLEKQIAKEHHMPVDAVKELLSPVYSEIKIFPIPHTIWYFTTSHGDDIEVASDYFGGDIDYDEDVLNEYFWLDEHAKIYKDWYDQSKK